MTTVPSAARAAFFQTAVTTVTPARAPMPAAPVQAQAQTPQSPTDAQKPDRPLRPGSIVDIRV